MRLFAGLALPAHVVMHLTRLRLRLASPKDGLRWSSPEQWHITLRFFGELQASHALSVQDALQHLNARSVDLEMSALGLFPAKGILYSAVTNSPELQQLHAAVEAQVAAAGILPESLPFRPHITLARSKGKTGAKTLGNLCTPVLPAFGPALRWAATEITLYESVLDQAGAQHHVLAQIPLRP